jgi:hypothetical protein
MRTPWPLVAFGFEEAKYLLPFSYQGLRYGVQAELVP